MLILVTSLIAVVYVGRVVETAWLREPSALAVGAKDPPISMLLPMLMLAVATIFFGIDTEASAAIARRIAEFSLLQVSLEPPRLDHSKIGRLLQEPPSSQSRDRSRRRLEQSAASSRQGPHAKASAAIRSRRRNRAASSSIWAAHR